MKLVSIVLAVFVSGCMASGYQGSATYGSNGYSQSYSGQSYSGQSTSGQGYATSATQSPTMTATSSATYINGYQLTLDEKAQLEQLVGYVIPAGRYQIDAQYNFAREGEAPFDNLGRLAQAQQQSGSSKSGGAWSMHSRDASGQGSTLVDDGNGCMIMSTPSGSISSGC